MNCGKAQRWLSARRDGVLAEARARRLDAHLQDCPACREVAAALGAVTQRLQGRPSPAGPTPEVAWADVQRALRLQADAPLREPFGSRAYSPWARWARIAAALVVLGAGAALFNFLRGGSGSVGVANAAPATQVLRVTTGLADAPTMVYEDHETGWTVVWVLPPEDGNHARM
jgi:predicted anti-sigma-YlaC factor YlaD